MEHTRQLLSRFRAIGFRLDPTRIPFSEWQLPDRRLFENPDQRRENVTSYAIPNSSRIPEYAPIAFYTDLYVRRNISRYRGDRVKSRPTGFFIVAYKSGEVKRVPVEEARLIPSRTGALITGFPGMPGYEVNGRRLPFVEVVAPPDPPLAQLLSRASPSKSTPDSLTACVKK